MTYTVVDFASAYGEGSYTSCDYSPKTACATTPHISPLQNTGFDVLLAVSFASALISAALLIRFFRRSSKPQA